MEEITKAQETGETRRKEAANLEGTQWPKEETQKKIWRIRNWSQGLSSVGEVRLGEVLQPVKKV